jgi:uncharacterized protein (TIGR02145 family)
LNLTSDILMKTCYIFLLAIFLIGGLQVLSSCKKKPADDTSLVNLGDEDEPLPYTNADWMSQIDDSRYLYELSITGTHDAAADEHTSQQSWADDPFVVCQDYYISNQMLLGVRWFDIRLDLSGNVLTAHHSSYYLHKNFNDLLTAGLDFLQQHPTETIIYMIKQEHSSASDNDFAQAVYDYLKARSSDLSKFYMSHAMPMLGKVRGKLMIVSRYQPSNGDICGMSINWDDNTSGENVDNFDYPLWVQDHYSLNSVSWDTKSNQIRSGISFAQNSGNKRLYLNFTSGEADASGITIWEVAANVNQNIVYYLGDHTDWLHCGVLFVNFAGGSDLKDGDGNRTVTPGFVQDIIDHNDKSAPSVTMGTQTWMKRDLCTSHYQNGDTIAHVTDPGKWSTINTGAYCEYNNTSQGDYGYLYNWMAVNDPRGLCPKGWHVPADEEWNTLINYFDGPDQAGGALKEPGTTHWIPPNWGAYNIVGYNALPGGMRDQYGGFGWLGEAGFWWSSSDTYEGASTFIMITSDASVQNNHYTQRQGHSVRCIRD